MSDGKHRGGLVNRRAFLAAGAAVPLCTFLSRGASSAAEFSLKFGTGQDPTHPNNVRMQEALDRIRERSGGRLDIALYPSNQLGSETSMLAQVRGGGIDFILLSTSILATLVSVAGIGNTAYAFPDYSMVWKGLDGELGKYIQSQAAKSGLVAEFKIWDNGFRQITSSSRDIRRPEDLKGFKIRVPPAPMLTSFFTAMGGSPAPLNFNEVYSALQTKVIDGQENPLAIIATTKLYEVQKYCSMTAHSWDGYWPLGNRSSWRSLPDDLRQLVVTEFDRSAQDQRAELAALNEALRKTLAGHGMQVNDVDRGPFRTALSQTSYYTDWKAKYGEEAWSKLEAAAGTLAI
jgi:tripartite ATP-independent transporter DctP family solute receptor